MRSFSSGWNTMLAKLGFRRIKRGKTRGSIPLSRRLRFESLEDRRVLAAVMVTNNTDVVSPGTDLTSITALVSNPGADGISLREAMLAANNDSAADIITFDGTKPGINGGQILLTIANGSLNITNPLTIDASSLTSGITINGNDPSTGSHTGTGIRIFDVTDPMGGSTPNFAQFIGLTMKGADTTLGGGAIRSTAQLVVRNCTIQSNEADTGGGIFVQVAGGGAITRTVLTVDNSLVEENFAYTGQGVAVFSGSSVAPTTDTILITGGSISSNRAYSGAGGGGIYAELYGAKLTIQNGTFSFNGAGLGGGLYAKLGNASSVQIITSTFANNEATRSGGGIYADIQSTSSLVVNNSIVSGNKANTSGGADGGGGGIYALVQPYCTLAVTGSQISANIAANGGGVHAKMPALALSDDGAVFTVQRSRIEGNRATSRGGGLYTATGPGGQVRVEDSVITGNDAGIKLNVDAGPLRIADSGGGMYAFLVGSEDPVPASLTIAGTEISANTAGRHGGGLTVCAKREGDPSIAKIAKLSVYNSTLSGNVAGYTTNTNYGGSGGGAFLAIYDNSFAPQEAMDGRIENVTITNNSADQGGGVFSLVTQHRIDTRNDVWLTNSIASANHKHDGVTASNLYGSFDILNTVFNIIGTDDGPGTSSIWDYASHMPAQLLAQVLFTNTPTWGPLQLNGGPTKTHGLLAGSPAIDAGNNALAIVPFSNVPSGPGTMLTFDQRGARRVYDFPGVPGSGVGPVDIGAYELGLPEVLNVTISSTTVNPYGTNPPYEFKGHVGSEEQLRTVPVGGANRIAIQFSQDVTGHIAQDDLQLIALNFYQPVPTPIFGYDPTTLTATWTYMSGTLPAPLLNAQYLLRLKDASVLDSYGNKLDGEWTNPGTYLSHVTTSKFPSGDGVAGGDFKFIFTILRGDAKRDLHVWGPDFSVLLANYDINGSYKTWDQGDFNGDGVTFTPDFVLMLTNYNANWQVLTILGDYNGDFMLTTDDLSHLNVDFDRDGVFNSTADLDLFNALMLAVGSNLHVVVV